MKRIFIEESSFIGYTKWYTKEKCDMHLNNDDDNKDDGYKFIEETIKPASTKRTIFNYILKICISGIAFGMFACLAFYGFRPWLSEVFKENNKSIVIERDEELPEDGILQEDNYDTEKFIETFNDIHEVASKAASSIISVKPYSYDETRAEFESDSVAGAIIAENDESYFVVALDSVCDDAEYWRANLRYGNECNIGLVKRDANTGLAVFRIIKEGLPLEVKNVIKVANLGNSNMLMPGNISMAVGDIFGKRGGTDYGIIKSADLKEIVADRHYSMISIDMFPVASSGGFLFNTDGELTGIFSPQHAKDEYAKAIGISELKPIIELLVNGQSVPYAGIYSETISESISQEKDIPYGAYVLQVQRDSPAMEAGISNGDIITKIGKNEIKTVQDYEQTLLGIKPGETVEVLAKRKGAAGYVDITFQLVIGIK